MSNKIEAYLLKKKSQSTSDIAEVFQTLENLYSRKLWHQLTQELHKQVYNPSFASNVDLKDLYDNFISDLEFRINLLSLAEISIPISRQVYAAKGRDGSLEFLTRIQGAVKKDKQAMIRINTGIIEVHLAKQDPTLIDIPHVRNLIEEVQKEVDDLVGVTPVHAPFYKVSATYLKLTRNHAAYYREALRYLGCEDAQKLSETEKLQQAMLLGFAALLGENIYNFGELLAHPILNALKGSEHHWIVDVLFSFNSGDLKKFREYENQWSKWDDIKKSKEALEGKIRLLCLMEIALGRNSKDRQISFKEISEKALIDVNKVEFLVMKALSKGLVKGSIDQVNRVVHINWVQPRVLTPAQVYQMSERIGAWRADVESMENVVQENAKEILMKT